MIATSRDTDKVTIYVHSAKLTLSLVDANKLIQLLGHAVLAKPLPSNELYMHLKKA